MKAAALNGSPRKNGNTYFALRTACDILNEQGIETKIYDIGSLKISGCRACGACAKLGKCAVDDGLNELAEEISQADGLIIGSPVYYADINGTLKCFLDRFFYTCKANMRFKPAAAIVALRRSGVTHAYQTLYNYFTITEMLITPTPYWPGIHGRLPGEAEQDLEGMYVARNIGKNMAYLLKLMEKSNIPVPEKDEKVYFNYIR